MYTHQRLHHEPHGVIERRDNEDDTLGELVRAGAHGEPVEVERRRLCFRPGREVLDRGANVGERTGDRGAGGGRGGVEVGQGGVGGSLAFFKPRTSRHAQFALECGAAHVRMYSLHEARAVLLQQMPELEELVLAVSERLALASREACMEGGANLGWSWK